MGPLQGRRIVEIAGIGPGQFCGMLLADMGAQVLRIVRADGHDFAATMPDRFNLMNRSRPAVVVDLKRPEGAEFVLGLCRQADALFEGFRPGVMERLGLGPDACMARNPGMVYGRMTGWGQDGPLAAAAGHDTNYIALSGVLASIGEAGGAPVLPLNLVADFGGGGLYLALGLLAAMLETASSGRGQVVDAAMVDGSASMMTMFHGLMAAGLWRDRRGSNLLDGAAPFMRTYATRDGHYVAVAALERRFYRNLLEGMELLDLDPDRQMQIERWPQFTRRFEETFRTRTRDEWCAILDGRDACFSPVLTLTEAPRHPHNQARGTYVAVDGIVQPAPAPRFSRTPAAISAPPAEPGRDAEAALAGWGVSPEEVQRLAESGAIRLA
jgi:alpha-methylacyl-CoA racemase